MEKLPPRIIATVAEELEDGRPIFFRKICMKYGFWRMLCQSGAELKFAYALTGEGSEEKIWVVPSSL